MLDVKKLLTKLLNRVVKTKSVQISNLAQYSVSSYYVTVPNLKTLCGIPNDSTIVSVTVNGWGGLGTVVNVGMQAGNGLFVFFANGTTITSSSYITILIAYM